MISRFLSAGRRRWPAYLSAFALTLAWCGPVLAQQTAVASPGIGDVAVSNTSNPASSPKTQVMILGVYHFDNPNQDYVKTAADDHLSPKRQAEITEVVELLAKFKPTKIALEAVDGASKVPQNYEAYLASSYTLKADERDQLGMRLARLLGLRRIYAIDHKLDMDFGAVMAAAQQSGDKVFLSSFQSAFAELQELQKRQSSMTVREILNVYNGADQINRARDLYLQISRVRLGDKFVGADVLSGWYQRNFRIFSNLARIIDSPDDRVLVIFGAGHAAILRDLVLSSPDLQLVDATAYLRRP